MNCTCGTIVNGVHSHGCPLSPGGFQTPITLPAQPLPKGWVCPVCESGVAPQVQRCPCKSLSYNISSVEIGG